MKITIIGTGYVGLVTGACFAEMGNDVTCVDIDRQKIRDLNNGIIPIYEPGLGRLITEGFTKETLHFSTDLKNALVSAKVAFIAVGTPQGEDGSADLKYVLGVAEEIGREITDYLVVVDKSTVPVGTADRVQAAIRAELERRQVSIPFDVVSNPEFLKEGAAIHDFMKPDRVVVGTDSERALEIMQELYRPFTMNHERFIAMDVRSAEMTKYAANAMLATKISFMNEIASICEKVGADVNQVRQGIGSDQRIGFRFIYPGIGFGGSCFPKDVRALIRTAESQGMDPELIRAVVSINRNQRVHFVNRIIAHFSTNSEGAALKDRKFAVWGLSFKPETDDMREAPSLTVIPALIDKGAVIRAFDPHATQQAKDLYFKGVEGLTYCQNKYEALDGADALLLLTEWKEFRSPDFTEIKNRLKTPIIFDGRNQYNRTKLRQLGFTYYQIGVAATKDEER
ncbi:MAG: UDP-glucose/GDP-mannose dehydrogenase family protein [FCB group bacterium]|nr:UDP-glucose/GDP-mannose dehydrogenase family protein [FCB group bacterium]